MATDRLELSTLALLARCSNRLSYAAAGKQQNSLRPFLLYVCETLDCLMSVFCSLRICFPPWIGNL